MRGTNWGGKVRQDIQETGDSSASAEFAAGGITVSGAEFAAGGFAVSAAGHDAGKCYVIFRADQEYVYLVDGLIRTSDRPKKKKKKHVRMLPEFDQEIAYKIRSNRIRDEEIRRAVRLLLKTIRTKTASSDCYEFREGG